MSKGADRCRRARQGSACKAQAEAIVKFKPIYHKARNEMQELVRAQKNVERFFAEEKDTTEKTQTR